MRKALLTVPVIALAAAACTGTGSFKEQTEEFLNDDSRVVAEVGGDVSNAECVEPENTDVDTTYTCVADVEGIGEVTFDVVITADDAFTVTPRL